ncbi:hypothetical protein ABZV24_24595 [Streptomyces sp. NPDC005251]|uniref:hypothetical protein n=1 Tax=Streptomyces sp. NPDC005251 TaxID=3157166 RepID=UPI0033AD2557
MIKEKLDALPQMTDEDRAMPFPHGSRDLDIDDQDLAMLDADTYGYASRVPAGRCPISSSRSPLPPAPSAAETSSAVRTVSTGLVNDPAADPWLHVFEEELRDHPAG